MIHVTSTMKQIQYGLSSRLRLMMAVTGLLQDSSPDHCYFCQLIFQCMMSVNYWALLIAQMKAPIMAVFPIDFSLQTWTAIFLSSEGEQWNNIYFSKQSWWKFPIAAWKNVDVSFFWNAACETQLQVEAQCHVMQNETENKSWSFIHWSGGENPRNLYKNVFALIR